jgi:hypothetical protein
MRNKILVLAVFIMVFELLHSKPRTAFEALQLARTQISGSIQKVPAAMELNLVYTAKDSTLAADNGLYYIYNKGVNSGYVIISGDDRANTVLGYSNDGSFDINQIPDGLKYWLNGFATEIKSIVNQPNTVLLTVNSAPVSVPLQKAIATSVAPLLGGIQWNQSSPYNDLCPLKPTTTSRCVTGCVATAMAQVMDYYKWPVIGSGSNSYTTKTNKIALSVDFSQTQYDWANMTDTYGTTSTQVQKTAVSTLMYHCGVAINMDYDLSSSASSNTMAKSLITYFGYDKNLQILTRDFYTRSEWSDILKAEINASRPVLYSGQSATSGHLFVCDGYDSNGYFHFNWGWGGMSNGYFEITALNPSNQGIGGGSGGFNVDQSIVSGLQKPTATTNPIYIICNAATMTYSLPSFARTGSVTISGHSIFNLGINTFTGDMGLALYNSSGTMVQLLKTNTVSNLQSNYGWSNYDITSVTIPAGVANGSYKLYWVYKASTESNWQIMRSKVGTPNFLKVDVSSTLVNLNLPTNVQASLTLNSATITGNLYQNKIGRFTVNFTNNGAGEYYSKIGIQLTSKTNSSITQVFTEDADFIPGETKSYYLNDSISVAPDQYTLSVLYDAQNNWTSTSTFSTLGNSQTVTVAAAPTETPNLTLLSKISFPNSLAVQKDNAVLSATILNSSGYYDKKLIAFIFPAAGGSSLTYIGYQSAIFDTNEQKTITFGNSISLPINTVYMVAVYYQNASNAWTQLPLTSNSVMNFTLVDNISAVNVPTYLESFDIFPSPATNVIQFNSEVMVHSIKIFDLSGKMVQDNKSDLIGNIRLNINNLKSGDYIIQINTVKGIKISKFIKL